MLTVQSCHCRSTAVAHAEWRAQTQTGRSLLPGRPLAVRAPVTIRKCMMANKTSVGGTVQNARFSIAAVSRPDTHKVLPQVQDNRSIARSLSSKIRYGTQPARALQPHDHQRTNSVEPPPTTVIYKVPTQKDVRGDKSVNKHEHHRLRVDTLRRSSATARTAATTSATSNGCSMHSGLHDGTNGITAYTIHAQGGVSLAVTSCSGPQRR